MTLILFVVFGGQGYLFGYLHGKYRARIEDDELRKMWRNIDEQAKESE